MKLDYLHLLGMLLPVILLYLLLIYKLTERTERIFISIIFWGLYFYGGLGASSIEVPIQYSINFLVFMSVFVFFYRLKIPFSHIINNSMSRFYQQDGKTFLDDKRYTQGIIAGYILVHIFSMVYPEFKLFNIFSPPAPNVIDALRESIEKPVQTSFLVKIIFYFKLLFLPFYYLALSKFRTRPLVLFVMLFIPLYLEYCSEGYIGRGLLLMNMALWFLVVYRYNRSIRVPLTITTIIAVPFLLIMFYIYSIARMDAVMEQAIGANVLEELLYQEINFAETFMDVVNSGSFINLKAFFVWLITLPIPKFLLGGIQVPLINMELSEIVLDIDRDNEFFWVRLNGFVTESYYIFGPYFYWIEAVILSRVIKTLFFFLRSIKHNEILILYCSVFLGFMFSRAGLGAIMPQITNGFLLLYLYFGVKAYLANNSLKKL